MINLVLIYAAAIANLLQTEFAGAVLFCVQGGVGLQRGRLRRRGGHQQHKGQLFFWVTYNLEKRKENSFMCNFPASFGRNDRPTNQTSDGHLG